MEIETQYNVKLDLVKGDYESFDVVFTDSETGDPFDLTGLTFMFTMNKHNNDTDDERAVVTLDLPAPEDPTEGILPVNISDDVLEEVDEGVYPFDVQYVDGDGKPKTVIIGEATVILDVTKRKIPLEEV